MEYEIARDMESERGRTKQMMNKIDREQEIEREFGRTKGYRERNIGRDRDRTRERERERERGRETEREREGTTIESEQRNRRERETDCDRENG